MTTNFEVAKKLEDIVNDNRTALNLATNGLYYGDITKIPTTPCICIESGDKDQELNGAPRRVMITGTNYILVYHSEVKSPSANREDDDQYAEQVEALVHADATLGGLVIDSLVRTIEFGYQIRSNTLYRASRLTVEARWQEMLPYPL